MMLGTISSRSKGFTLIELLIVVAIIGVLSGLGIWAYMLGIDRAKNARAQSDLNRLAKAIAQLNVDTGLMPNKESVSTCDKSGGIISGAAPGNSIFFSPGHQSLNRSGLWNNFANNDGSTGPAVTSWKGPYMDGDISQVPLDPWGNPYEYDGDYICKADVKGCERYIGTLDNDRALISWGKDKIVYTADDIAYVFCGIP
jgi:prepilin-type N-terminal cleavage/methylation domain-containing protein